MTGVGLRSNVVEKQNRSHAEDLVQRLMVADIAKVPDIIEEIERYRLWANPLLEQQNEKAAEGSPQKLRIGLALLPVDPGQRDYLYRRLRDAEPHEVAVLCTALIPYKEDLLEQLWAVVEQPAQGKEKQRLRAASALAIYDPETRMGESPKPSRRRPRWGSFGASGIVDGFFTSGDAKLLSPLGAVFRDAQRRETERSLATDALADFAAARPEVLVELLLDADEKQFAVLFPKLSDYGERFSLLLASEISKELPRAAPEDDKEKLAKRQANAAAALLRLGRPESVWSFLKHGPDPRRRIYLIHRLGPLGVLRPALLGRLDEETDATIRRSLVLSLGEFDERNWLITERNAVVEQVQRLYRTADDPGVHGAAEWLLRHWKLKTPGSSKWNKSGRRMRNSEAEAPTHPQRIGAGRRGGEAAMVR